MVVGTTTRARRRARRTRGVIPDPQARDCGRDRASDRPTVLQGAVRSRQQQRTGAPGGAAAGCKPAMARGTDISGPPPAFWQAEGGRTPSFWQSLERAFTPVLAPTPVPYDSNRRTPGAAASSSASAPAASNGVPRAGSSVQADAHAVHGSQGQAYGVHMGPQVLRPNMQALCDALAKTEGAWARIGIQQDSKCT